MDRILKAEGKSPDEFKVAKQADALMTFYNLVPDEVTGILSEAGYSVKGDLLRASFDYYIRRTSHGSTLSKLVHSYLANSIGDKELSWRLYAEALESDYIDIQGGTTGEGIHTGVMAGTAVLALKSYAGLSFGKEGLGLNPRLPAAWRKIGFNILFRGDRYSFVATPKMVEVKVASEKKKVDILFRGRKVTVAPHNWESFELEQGEP
jgi:trehalose/maltose hydrolase-like predicted phosphorylase